MFILWQHLMSRIIQLPFMSNSRLKLKPAYAMAGLGCWACHKTNRFSSSIKITNATDSPKTELSERATTPSRTVPAAPTAARGRSTAAMASVCLTTQWAESLSRRCGGHPNYSGWTRQKWEEDRKKVRITLFTLCGNRARGFCRFVRLQSTHFCH
jgi:hypothetical protein